MLCAFSDHFDLVTQKMLSLRYEAFLKKSNYFCKKLYLEAIAICSKPTSTAFKCNLPDIATITFNLAVVYDQEERYTDARRSYTESLATRREQAKTDPTTYLPDVANTLFLIAGVNLKEASYAIALSQLIEARNIWRELSENTKDGWDKAAVFAGAAATVAAVATASTSMRSPWASVVASFLFKFGRSRASMAVPSRLICPIN